MSSPAPAFSLRMRRALHNTSLLLGLLLIAQGGATQAWAQTSSTGQNVLYMPDKDVSKAMPGGLMAEAVGTESFYYDTNPLLLTSGAKSLWGSITSPELIISDKTPLTSIVSDTVFNSNNFNQSNFSSNDVHTRLKAQKQTERWSAGLAGNADYDTTRTSELSNYNLRLTPVRHFGGTLTPSLGYNFLATDEVALQGSYTSSTYDGPGFTDFETYSVTPSYSHQFDQRNTGSFSLAAQRYSATKGPFNVTDTLTPTIGWQTTFTQNLTGNAGVGLQEVRQKGIVNTPWKTEYVFNGGLNYKDQSDNAQLSASRMQYPFGNGTEALVTQVSLTDTHMINQLFAVSGNVSYQSASYQSGAFGSLDSLATAGGGAIYHAAEHWDVSANYQYRHETLVGLTSEPDDHMMLLSLTYRPQAWHL